MVPSVTTALVIGWLLAAKAKWNVRRWVGLATATIAFISWTLVRVDGVSGDLSPELALRWSSTQEEAFLVSGPTSVEQPIASTVAETRLGDWPAFRGVARDSVVTEANLNGANLRTWARSQPTPRWRQRVGPAWSSFAIIGDLVMTQEQRGEKEAIVAYHADTGRQVWQHTHQARFDEMLAGVGPRGTPTIANGRLYAVGATGLVSCLEVATGELTWEVDLKQETTSTGPIWGFSCSPLVVGDLLLVHAGGGENDAVVAFQLADGEVRWKQGTGTSYASPHIADFDGEEQVLFFDEYGLESRVPTTGDLIWSFDWNATHEQEARIIQPWVGDDGVILVGSESNLIRLKVSQDDGEWTVSEQWRSRDLKPDFNDLVVHEGHIYGFDGSVFCCLDLATGKRKWRSRGYGKGQVLLVPSEGLLLVLSEQGEVALLEADSGKRKEIARFPALGRQNLESSGDCQWSLVHSKRSRNGLFRLEVVSAESPAAKA